MTSTEALNNFFLSVIIIFTVYFILDLTGNAMLLKSTGQKMWIGFIPVVNDFFIFRSFWNAKMFVVYIASFTINILASKSDNVYIAAIRLVIYFGMYTTAPLTSTVTTLLNISALMSSVGA